MRPHSATIRHRIGTKPRGLNSTKPLSSNGRGVLLLPLATVRPGNVETDSMQAGEAPIGHLYDVEGRPLLLHQSGSGRPAVVFVPGAGLVGLDYLNIHDQVSRLTTSVIYDRAGTGWSGPVELPRTASAVSDELRSLLCTAGVSPPYLLVGHSLGGIYVRRYAQRFPGEVAGILFLDPAHEDYATAMPKQSLFGTLQQWIAVVRVLPRFKRFYRDMFERMFAKWPDSIRAALIDYHLGSLKKSLEEWPARSRKNLKGELLDEIHRGGDMPDVPVIVLVAMGLDPFMAAFMPESYLREVNRRKQIVYTRLAESVARGEQRAVENAGHTTIHTDCPDAVMQALRDLLDRVDR
jgi:pimeloyl-ACP methyl ester carboxylesterase